MFPKNFLTFWHHYKDATFETAKCSSKKANINFRAREYPFRPGKKNQKEILNISNLHKRYKKRT